MLLVDADAGAVHVGFTDNAIVRNGLLAEGVIVLQKRSRLKSCCGRCGQVLDSVGPEPLADYNSLMPYPAFIAPMRAELTDLGARELRTVADFDAAIAAPGVTISL